MHYFASDIHLGAGTKAEAQATEQRFVAWLDFVKSDAETLFLLGDIFDFWFEYRKVVPKGFVRTLAKLAELSESGVRVVMLTGNHDMWVREYLTEECGVELYTTPQTFTLDGRTIFVAHGDNMRIEGEWMLQLMNSCFRSRLLRCLFSWLVHPDLALSFGQAWSASSRKKHASADDFTEALTEPLIDYARDWAKSHTVDHFVFGHMHYPRDYHEEGLHVVSLGCWDLTPSYAQLDKEGNLTLIKLD